MRQVVIAMAALLFASSAQAQQTASNETPRKVTIVTTVTTVETGRSTATEGPAVTYNRPTLEDCNAAVRKTAEMKMKADPRFRIEHRCEWR